MKTIKRALFVGIILLSFTAYTQSKKDLQLQVQQLQQELSKSKNQADSLDKIQNKQISDLNKQVKTISDTITARTNALA